MKKSHLVNFLICCFFIPKFLFCQTNPTHTKVNGYHRSDGTYIKSHYRTAPNSTNTDNFSTTGNINPYTGKAGWIEPDNRTLNTGTFSTENSFSNDNFLYTLEVKEEIYCPTFVKTLSITRAKLRHTLDHNIIIKSIPTDTEVIVTGKETFFWKVIYDGESGLILIDELYENNKMKIFSNCKSIFD